MNNDTNANKHLRNLMDANRKLLDMAIAMERPTPTLSLDEARVREMIREEIETYLKELGQ